jgi:hypothetical protein
MVILSIMLALRGGGGGNYVHWMCDASNEAQMLKSKLSLKGVPGSCRRDKRLTRMNFRKSPLVQLWLLKSSCYRSG